MALDLALFSRRASRFSLQTDAELVLERVNGIRNAYTLARDRQPLSFENAERRASTRVPLKVDVLLTPVRYEADEVRRTAESDRPVAAITTNLSLRGVGFTHDAALPLRHLLITFDVPASGSVSLLAELRWTTPEPAGGFHSGARFLALIETP